ncbi:serum response factor-like [Sycon ciliatum]|uniref:serum response factor-like n=1 Tax=Sycon ciliatum TaxID=27933 RepID=UPI0020AC2C93|eukprot:scpid42604/ scgid29692/ Serum response factor
MDGNMFDQGPKKMDELVSETVGAKKKPKRASASSFTDQEPDGAVSDGEDGDDGDEMVVVNGEPVPKKKKTKGRVKIKMEFINNKLRRYTTFSKRKTGIMKKAYELSTLTGTQIMLLVASETGHVYTFATPKLQPMITSESGKALIQTCLNTPDPPADEQTSRMVSTGYEETDLGYPVDTEDDSKQASDAEYEDADMVVAHEVATINPTHEVSCMGVTPPPPPLMGSSETGAHGEQAHASVSASATLSPPHAHAVAAAQAESVRSNSQHVVTSNPGRALTAGNAHSVTRGGAQLSTPAVTSQYQQQLQQQQQQAHNANRLAAGANNPVVGASSMPTNNFMPQTNGILMSSPGKARVVRR